MLFPPSTNRLDDVRRCIGAVLFVFVFALPLHFHPTTEISQVSQDCTCYHTGRAQLGPALAPVILALTYTVVFLVARRSEIPAAVMVESESARGPPYSV